MNKLFSAFAIAVAMMMSVPMAHAGGGSDVPFPLDYPLPFPWDKIEGVWVLESQDFTAMYAFKVMNEGSGQRILKVLQLDPRTEDVLAEGIGYQADKLEQVYAAMTASNGSYLLTVGAYEDTTAVPKKKAYVLSLSSFGDSGEKPLRFAIRKVRKKVPVQVEEPSLCQN